MSVSFTADRKDLLSAVEDAGRGCAKTSYVQILRGLHVEVETEQAHLTGTDLEVTVEASCPADKCNPGKFVIEDTRKATAMLKALDDGPVTVSATTESATFKQGDTTLRLGVHHVDDFPASKSVVTVDSTFEVRTADLLSVWKRVGKMFSGDESRPVLTAVHVKSEDYRVTFEATDSYRLAFDWMQAKVTGTASALIRGETIELVSRFAKRDPEGLVAFTVDTPNELAVIEVDGITVTTKLIQGQFPDVERLLPDKFEGEFDIDVDATVKACRRVEKLNGTKSTMRLVVPTQPGKARIYTLNDKIVDTDQFVPVPRTTGKNEFEIGLNPGFFAEAVEAMGGNIVTVKCINPLRPILVVNGKEGAGVLQMPIKIG